MAFPSRDAQVTPSDNCFVADLPAGTTEDNIRTIFANYGTVIDCKIVGSNTPQTAAALVRFTNVEEATWIVQNINGNIPEGLSTPVTVRFASSKGGKKGGGKGSSLPDPTQDPRDIRFRPYPGSVGAVQSQPFVDGGCMGMGMGMVGMGMGVGIGYMGGVGPSLGTGSIGIPGQGALMDMTSMDGGACGACCGKKGRSKGKDSGSSIREIKQQLAQTILPGGFRSPRDENTVFVAGLPPDTNNLDMYHVFSTFGAIAQKGATAHIDKNTGECIGSGFVNYLDPMAANAAIMSLNGVQVPNAKKPLEVKIKAQSSPSEIHAAEAAFLEASQ
eukprot:TRINITY_DN24152_c0_g1_i2.p1 TRINITY_DN24152_c0_g1~~TRINITY_DN24152_c0_g1_i2.p1  ORF type:complete len:330 (-),score=55.09 TRINITY_DN24152_c0_g1_i2:94-1083(-)